MRLNPDRVFGALLFLLCAAAMVYLLGWVLVFDKGIWI